MTSLVARLALARPRLGLAARASLFVTGLLAVTAAICAVTVMIGLENESQRHQLAGAREVSNRVAHFSAGPLLSGERRRLAVMTARMASRSEVHRIAVFDLSGQLVAASGAVGLAEERALAAEAARQRALRATRARTGELIVTETITGPTGPLGVSVLTIKPDGFRYNGLQALAPFFLWLGCLALIAIPLTAFVVRRALSPLETLTRFAERVGEGHMTPITLSTHDEFETLARAFNRMIARLDESVRKIQSIAFVDPVTQLPNQDRFTREIDFFMLQDGQEGQIGGVLVFQFQRLGPILQTLDPEATRDLMRAVAERFVHAVRVVDRIVRLTLCEARPAAAARIGACDFAVFAPALVSTADAARMAQHLNAALDQLFEWRGHKLCLGVSCGVALAPRDGKDADAVIRRARMALGAAHTAPARLKMFTQSLDRAAITRLSIERDMRAALDRNEFHAFFQPKVNLANGRIEACEALARWVREDRTIISPARFIPVAEETGLIEPLSNAILREACWKAAAWARAGYPIKVAVNISVLQFRNERFAEQVLSVLQSAGLSPSALELEVTESLAMEDSERALRLIAPLRAAGVRFAIDDFGCGHSSLAALSKLPFDVIKIDQQFTHALGQGDAQAAAITDMILALAGALGLDAVAEGVERPEQAAFVASRGCRWGQGFLYGAAMPPARFLDVLRAQAGAAGEHAA